MVTRAWFVAHNGAATILSMLLTGMVVAFVAHETVPSLRQAPLPLGMLSPSLIATLSALGVTCALPTPRRRDGRVILARSLWLLLVCAVSAGAAAVIATAYEVPGLVPATVVLVLVSYGASCLLGNAAPIVGAAVAIAILANMRAFAGVGTETWAVSGLSAVAFFGAGVLGGVVYLGLGSKADARFGG